jgi:hypothetical protein
MSWRSEGRYARTGLRNLAHGFSPASHRWGHCVLPYAARSGRRTDRIGIHFAAVHESGFGTSETCDCPAGMSGIRLIADSLARILNGLRSATIPASLFWYVRFRQQWTYGRKCLWPLSARS